MIIIWILIALSLLVYIFSTIMWILMNYVRTKAEYERIVFINGIKKDLGEDNGTIY